MQSNQVYNITIMLHNVPKTSWWVSTGISIFYFGIHNSYLNLMKQTWLTVKTHIFRDSNQIHACQCSVELLEAVVLVFWINLNFYKMRHILHWSGILPSFHKEKALVSRWCTCLCITKNVWIKMEQIGRYWWWCR